MVKASSHSHAAGGAVVAGLAHEGKNSGVGEQDPKNSGRRWASFGRVHGDGDPLGENDKGRAQVI